MPLSVMFSNKVHGAALGDKMYLEGCMVGDVEFASGPYEVIEVNDDFTGVTLGGVFGDDVPVPTEHSVNKRTMLEL